MDYLLLYKTAIENAVKKIITKQSEIERVVNLWYNYTKDYYRTQVIIAQRNDVTGVGWGLPASFDAIANKLIPYMINKMNFLFAPERTDYARVVMNKNYFANTGGGDISNIKNVKQDDLTFSPAKDPDRSDNGMPVKKNEAIFEPNILFLGLIGFGLYLFAKGKR